MHDSVSGVSGGKELVAVRLGQKQNTCLFQNKE
jgi:hypothetical protein